MQMSSRLASFECHCASSLDHTDLAPSGGRRPRSYLQRFSPPDLGDAIGQTSSCISFLDSLSREAKTP